MLAARLVSRYQKVEAAISELEVAIKDSREIGLLRLLTMMARNLLGCII
jgi:hypothetical protein